MLQKKQLFVSGIDETDENFCFEGDKSGLVSRVRRSSLQLLSCIFQDVKFG